MGTYEIPRNLKGEGRILMIFSTKALIYTVIGLVVGLIFYFIFNSIGLKIVGIIILALLGIIGFVIGTFKIPEIDTFSLTRKCGGSNIDEIIIKGIKFKKKRNKIYTYVKEENKKWKV